MLFSRKDIAVQAVALSADAASRITALAVVPCFSTKALSEGGVGALG